MRILRVLLRLLPRPFRRDYGDAMEETLARRLDDARRRAAGHARTLLRESGGLLRTALTGRLTYSPLAGERRPGYSDARKAGQMDVMAQEIRHAARRLLRAPVFTAAAVSTLALAIGANVAIFAVVERVVLNPLPFPDSDRVVKLNIACHGSPRCVSRPCRRAFISPTRSSCPHARGRRGVSARRNDADRER